MLARFGLDVGFEGFVSFGVGETNCVVDLNWQTTSEG